MRRLNILLSFVPWVTFWLLYSNEAYSATICAFITVAIVILLEYKRLKKLFILPVSTVVVFTILGISAQFNLPEWFTHHTLLLLDFVLAGIIWLSILIKKPLTEQYAKETIARSYWKSPLFIRINWILSLIWAIAITATILPTIFISHQIVLESTFWNYVFGTLCLASAVYLNSKLPSILIGRNFWDTVAKLPTVDSHFLQNGFKPVREELTLNNLTIIGRIPDDLQGTYMRNGPNPYFTPYTYTYPIDGDGLIHSINLKNGNASYKNRFVKTKGLVAEIKAGKALFGGLKLPIPPDPHFIKNGPSKNTASIHVVRLDQNRILALYEASTAYVLNNNLDTIGEWKPNKIPNFLVNAHSRKDYNTNHTYMFTYSIDDPNSFLKLYEFDEQHTLINNIMIPKTRSSMIHDFVITQNHIVFFDTPAIFNVVNNTGNEPFFAFDDQQETDIYVINRKTFEIKTINNIDSFFIYHFVNAFELNHQVMNNQIIIDFVYHERLELNPSFNSKHPPLLYRGKINLDNLTYEHSPLSEQIVEFPSYNLKYTGQKYSYAYLLTKNSSNLTGFNAILKYNLNTLEQKIISFDENIELDEVTFVEKSHATAEDDGYLMMFTYNKTTDTSNFVILEANSNNKILATIELPVRVPHGLHGSWN